MNFILYTEFVKVIFHFLLFQHKIQDKIEVKFSLQQKVRN